MTPAWKAAGASYLPLFAAAELANGIPTDLLARIAFEECSWRPDVIDGTVKSSTGAVGIMQMEPVFFRSVVLTDPAQAIPAAGEYLKALHARFGDWQEAVCAYNWGPGSLHRFLAHGAPPCFPDQTRNYITQISADVPIPGAMIALLATTPTEAEFAKEALVA